MRRVMAAFLIAATAAGCQLLPSLGTGTVPLSLSGTGTFDCGSGFHGCTAWLAIRPADWKSPAGWLPGKDDRDFRPRASADDMSVWLVSGSGAGGPERLAPGPCFPGSAGQSQSTGLSLVAFVRSGVRFLLPAASYSGTSSGWTLTTDVFSSAHWRLHVRHCVSRAVRSVSQARQQLPHLGHRQ